MTPRRLRTRFVFIAMRAQTESARMSTWPEPHGVDDAGLKHDDEHHGMEHEIRSKELERILFNMVGAGAQIHAVQQGKRRRILSRL